MRRRLTLLDKLVLRGSLLAFTLGGVLIFFNILVLSAFEGSVAVREAAALPALLMVYAVLLLPFKLLAARIVRRGIHQGGRSERRQAGWAVTLTNLVFLAGLPMVLPIFWPILVSLLDEYLHWVRGIRAYRAALLQVMSSLQTEDTPTVVAGESSSRADS